MRERRRSWRSASLRQRSRNWNWCRTALRRLPGPCQRSLEITIFWRQIANLSRSWQQVASNRQKSSIARKRPTQATARTQTDSLFLKRSASGDHWIRLVSIYAQVLDGFVEYGALDLAVHEKLMQRCQRDETGIDLEEVAQSCAPFAAAEPIRAERGQAPRHPLADHIGQGLQVVGSGDEHPRRIREAFGDVGNARLFARVQSVPTLGLVAVVVEFLVAGHAPHVGSHAVLGLENFLRPQHFVQNCAASE